MHKITLLLLMLMTLCMPSLFADEGEILVSISAEQTAVRPGEDFWIAINFDLHEPWHCHCSEEEESGMGPQLNWTVPSGFAVSNVLWPPTNSFTIDQQASSGYNAPFTAIANVQVPPDAKPGETSLITVNIQWVACSNEMCVPGSVSKTLEVSVTDELVSTDPSVQALFAQARSKVLKEGEPIAMLNKNLSLKKPSLENPPVIPSVEFEGGLIMALALAFLGGMILNLMPCVLPVISFKVLSFVKMADQDRASILRHGLAFGAGVLVSFWTLAALLLILQAYGSSVGWGFQLQEPIFVAVLATVMLVFGLSMFGVFEFGAFFASWVGTHASTKVKHEGLFSAFCSGVLATAVATPCTGPFLGSAVGFAVTLPPFQALMIFTSLGLGMAFPYLLLSAFPHLLRFMPKPGAWMESFKQFMGFVMLASTLWLVWVFGFQTNANAQALMLLGLFVIALGCWVYGRWGAPHRTKRIRILSLVISLLILGLGGQFIFSAARISPEPAAAASSYSDGGGWEAFDPERLVALQAKGIPVFVDFTAKWCLICQTNHLVLSRNDVALKMMEHGVVKMKADWTRNDPMITTQLKKYGRSGVPLYLLFDGKAGGQPQVLPQVLSSEAVDEALMHLSLPIAEKN